MNLTGLQVKQLLKIQFIIFYRFFSISILEDKLISSYCKYDIQKRLTNVLYMNKFN
jgi:hypothetical protein